MKERKYRAFDANENMTYFTFTDLVTNNIPEPLRTIIKEEEWFVEMEWTERKDMAGKEIYEGDILEVNGYLFEVMYQHEYCGSFGSFVPEPITTEVSSVHQEVLERGIVIGNKYQHPELLTTPKNIKE